ncbi:hypothetical protein SKAU_G00039890 [Synaphobranchus kaupii]|uniref:Uncharacterized protein n=1 Tax=Synaphobranchus kaupii TaxID=118154 RepID=A0A9Q1GH79_SYNKA|nr:hypothetical protein SKAU_G00039890 [Synaphobranchus kaupii]
MKPVVHGAKNACILKRPTRERVNPCADVLWTAVRSPAALCSCELGIQIAVTAAFMPTAVSKQRLSPADSLASTLAQSTPRVRDDPQEKQTPCFNMGRSGSYPLPCRTYPLLPPSAGGYRRTELELLITAHGACGEGKHRLGERYDATIAFAHLNWDIRRAVRIIPSLCLGTDTVNPSRRVFLTDVTPFSKVGGAV